MADPAPGVHGAPDPASPDAAASRHHRPRGLRRSIRGLIATFLRRDTAIVTALVIATTLSAFAIYQATRADDGAEDAFGDARVIQSQITRDAGRLQAIVGHDMGIVTEYCDAALQASSAHATLLSRSPRIADLVAARLTMEALQPLVQGDRLFTCASLDGGPDPTAGYSLARAQEQAAASANVPTASAVTELTGQAAELDRREQLAMQAGILFALVVAALIFAARFGDREGRPRGLTRSQVQKARTGAVAVAAVGMAAGLVLLLVSAVDPVPTLLLLALFAVLVALELMWSRRRRARERAAAASSGAPAADEPESSPGRSSPQWWADVAGAAALVLLAAVAATLTGVAVLERDAGATSDRRAAQAVELGVVARQATLRDLDRLALLAAADARWTAEEHRAAVGGDDSTEQIIAARWSVLDDMTVAMEQSLRDQIAQVAAASTGDCPAPPDARAVSALALSTDIGRYPEWVADYLRQSEEGARACEILSDVAYDQARTWASHRALLTVALVVLGLSGFLFSLATDRDRTRRSSRTLFAVAAFGTIVGVSLSLTSVPDLIRRASGPDVAALGAAALTVADAERDACLPDLDVDTAVAVLDRYGPARAARAYADACAAEPYAWPASSSTIPGSSLASIEADLETALTLGPATLGVRADLGWFRILDGIENDDPAALARGLDESRAVLPELTASGGAVGSAHYVRANIALALAALGEKDRALSAYREAVRCLDAAAGCPGGGLLDPDERSSVMMGALADLELLAAGQDVEAYRLAVMSPADASPAGSDDGEARPSLELNVFPQELQLVGDVESDASVVWLYRAPGEDAWAVLWIPTLDTLAPGQHLGFPHGIGSLLPSGEYRADVYENGRREESDAVTWDQDSAQQRIEARWIGVSAVAPEDWSTQWENGTGWHIGPSEDEGVTVRRVEGVIPVDDPDLFLAEQLDLWFPGWSEGATEDPNDWFLGDATRAVFDGPDGSVYAAAYFPYTSGYWCGGAMIVAASTGGAAAEADVIRDMVLERAPEAVSAHPDVMTGDGFELAVPAAWDAVVRPTGGVGDLLTARDCVDDGIEADVQDWQSASPLGEEVDADLTPDAYPGLTVFSRTAIAVPGADEAVEVELTYIPDGWTDPATLRLVYAMVGDRVFRLSVYSWWDAELWRPVVDDMVASLVLTGSSAAR